MNHQELLDKLHREQVKDDFFSMFYHDLRNPLTAVIGSIDIVREGRLGALNGEQSDYLQSAIDSCNEVVAMIENLLDVRRFEAGKMQLTMQPLDPAETVRSAAHACERAAAFDSVTVITDIHDSPFTISPNLQTGL